MDVFVIKGPAAIGDSCSGPLVPFGNPDEIHLRIVTLRETWIHWLPRSWGGPTGINCQHIWVTYM